MKLMNQSWCQRRVSLQQKLTGANLLHQTKRVKIKMIWMTLLCLQPKTMVMTITMTMMYMTSLIENQKRDNVVFSIKILKSTFAIK